MYYLLCSVNREVNKWSFVNLKKQSHHKPIRFAVQSIVKGGVLMEAVTYSNFRQGLKSYLKQVNQDSEPLIVTSQNSDDNVVVISKNDYDEMMETMRMVSNPYLIEKIRKGDKQFKKSQFKTDH